jgi:hypothetical protein|tara:strand:+ start:3907 stop:4299 length:393 start_codon:yes stop_codon:yes gene_type:complete
MISIDDISKIAEKRNKLKKETYTKIYEQITKRIRQSVDMGQKYLFAQIPSYVMGYPQFDRLKAMQYIIRQFQIGGFMVQVVGEYEICISWRPTKKNKYRGDQNTQEDESCEDFPTLVNLKKAANKYRTAR